MITVLQKIDSKLSDLQEIPELFFAKIESASTFDDNLFPKWSTIVFAETDLKKKFEVVYNKYKAIPNKDDRDKIVKAFSDSNKIELLCSNDASVMSIEISSLSINIQKEIETLFLYLYSSALEYHKFETHTKDTLKKAIDRFIQKAGIQICPICGLEGYLNLDGQSRIALDHWLCKDLFPFVSVNFNNLIPIGDKCNSRPAKGTKNVLFDNAQNRIVAYYPFSDHGGINSIFSFITEPSIGGIEDEDWSLSTTPIRDNEQSQFNSWTSIFNINDRYKDYFRKYIFLTWEDEYKEFIKESGLNHANDIDELKERLSIWNAAFPIKKRSGAILYKAFINYLISQASNAYLYSLCENFKRHTVA